VRKPILVVGSVNLDLVVSVPRIPVSGETLTGSAFRTFFGGKGANQAVAVARLAYAVKMIAKVGDDDIGKRLCHGLKTAGVQTGAVGVAKKISSGVALISTDPQGHNSIVVVPGANAKLLPKDVLKHLSLVEAAGIVLTQLETPLETLVCVADLANRFGIPLMLDPAPARELPSDLLRQVKWLTPNESETRLLCGASAGELDVQGAKDYAEELLGRGPENIVIKLGPQGSFLATSDGRREHIPAFQVQAVDSTAAGDAFNAGFAVALMQGKDPSEAARFASAVAALSVTHEGAQPSMPTSQEVSRFLRSDPTRKEEAPLVTQGEEVVNAPRAGMSELPIAKTPGR
jgi:ribokinase